MSTPQREKLTFSMGSTPGPSVSLTSCSVYFKPKADACGCSVIVSDFFRVASPRYFLCDL